MLARRARHTRRPATTRALAHSSPSSLAPRKITELTLRLAETYAGISAKTLQRDLAAVEELGLIERSADGVRARRELILAFMP